MSTEPTADSFDTLGLSEPLRQAINDVGYEAPTPIQVKTIPLLLAGQDVIGQAQTGTGKTAAFALPILQKLDLKQNEVQALILTPTRELAIQVAEAIHVYAKRLKKVRVLPIYGGQSIGQQLRHLQSGVHIVVGTPGRVMDHLRRDTLNFDSLKMVVLDEADEMLRMGFIEDVEWILGQAPENLQTALFSATMPPEIRRVADRYLHHPATVEIEHKSLAVPTVTQRYLNVLEKQKLDVLSHVLETETEPGEAVLIFARTKVGAAEVAEKLQARGYAVEPMHGDMSQAQRENVIRRLRNGQVEMVVATDVAARGLDVERIGFVVNYDIPYDMEAYVHRIGRTGRAGRTGKTVLFVTPREQRLMRNIEQYVKQRIEPMKAPTRAHVAARRIALFKERILQTLADEDLDLYLSLVEELAEESGRDIAEIAAAAARLAREDKPLVVDLEPEPEVVAQPEEGMVRFFIEAGRRNGVRPADIVGAIANEAGVPGQAIGAIDIYDRFTFVDVPGQYREQVLTGMRGVAIRNREANIRIAMPRDAAAAPSAKKERGGKHKNIYRGKKGSKKFARGSY
ncbi:MAG: ATP-dependent helicase [Anaerolineae bacterium]|nr:DEAD/DEAH box helicase [Anaerolineales bacterium]MCQ3975115.1 ATP-dependent helicase [Anaerolineae bacterium]